MIKELIDLYNPKDVNEVSNALKDLLGLVIEDMMEAELEEHMGYEKNSHEAKETSNRRNGSYSKKLK
ncbi:MAG TPA: transposase, partial [Haloplasmataceae bacterium]